MRSFCTRVDGPISRVRGIPNDQCLDQVIVNLNDHFADGTVFQSIGAGKDVLNLVLIKQNLSKLYSMHLITQYSSLQKSSLSSQKTKIIATSWSNNWRKGFDVYQYLDQNLDFNRFEFTFVGNSPIGFKNIRHLPPLKSKDLGQELRSTMLS